MSSWQDITLTVGSALAVCWGVWTELRLRKQQSDNAQMLRAFNDEKIKEAVHGSSDDALRAELSKDVS